METMRFTYKNKNGMLEKRELIDPYDYLEQYKLGLFDGAYDFRVEFEGSFCEDVKPFKDASYLFLYIKLCQENEKRRKNMFYWL